MKLTRSSDGMIGGVAAGIAKATNIDVTLVRVAFVLVSLFAGGGLLVYLILWAVIPREEGGSIAEDGVARAKEWYDDQNPKFPGGPQDPQDPQRPQGPGYDI